MVESGEILTIAEAAQLLHINKITLYRHIKNGTIAVIKIGKAIRVSRAELLKALVFKPSFAKEKKPSSKKPFIIKSTDPLYLLSKNISK